MTAKYKVQKRLQSREGISKKDVPADIWTCYAKTSEYTTLTFIALTGKRSVAGKAKAKAKATQAKAKAVTVFHGSRRDVARAGGVQPKAKAKSK